MGIEIERKFLVADESWRQAEPHHFVQGYLTLDQQRTVRVRIDGERAFLTVKGISVGARRKEFEYAIPVDDARQLLGLCMGNIIEKWRHVVEHAGMRWEVDEFTGENAGLVVAGRLTPGDLIVLGAGGRWARRSRGWRSAPPPTAP